MNTREPQKINGEMKLKGKIILVQLIWKSIHNFSQCTYSTV